MFGHQLQLNFNKAGSHPTLIGGILSVPVYIFMIVYIYIVLMRINNNNTDSTSQTTTQMSYKDIGEIEIPTGKDSDR